jgi:hypothetical protein
MAIGGNAKRIESRLEIVAPLFRRCYTYRAIQREVMTRLSLKSYSLETVKSDVDRLLARWREQELADTGEYVRLELSRIDEAVKELWEQWEKSKEDYKKTSNRRKGKPLEAAKKTSKKAGNTEVEIRTIEREINEIEMRCLGDVSYISEIRAQLAERRKLLGLYAPEKRELTGKDGKDLTIEPIIIEVIDSRDKVDNAEDTDNGSVRPPKRGG